MYLLDRPNPHGNNFYRSRNAPILAVVVHITAGLEDLDATDDQSAEATARYAGTTNRAVSWHYGTDADSSIDLLPDGYTAFHCKGYNSCTLGHEISKRHTDWRSMPKKWRDATLSNAARADARRCVAHGIPIRHASRAELDQARESGGGPVGLLGHWELDPARRSDPGRVAGVGDTFPWAEYLALVRLYAGNNLTTHHPQEDTDMDKIMIRGKGRRTVAVSMLGRLVEITDDSTRAALATQGWVGPVEVAAQDYDRFVASSKG